MKKKVALSIAGSDPSSGAGIQADLKAFTALRVHGVTVVTCITVQNTQQVKTIHKLPVGLIEKQIDVLYEDIHPDAVKTGMLYDEEIVGCVAKKIKQHHMKTVVDPVMVATTGDDLSQENLVDAIKKKLIPQAYLLTPNLQEASMITGEKIDAIDDVKKACKIIHKMGARCVLIKGGHLEGKYAQDVFFNGREFTVFSLPRIPDKKAHGSGCTLSALITGYLALGEQPVEAVGKAKRVLWRMIKEGYQPGRGADVLNHSCYLSIGILSSFPTNEQFRVWLELKTAVDRLLPFLSKEYIPEVGMNIAFALPNAKKIDDICAINGRIVKTRDKTMQCGSLDFGASKHVASIVLAAMNMDPGIRCAMNIRYSEATVKKCKKMGFIVGTFDRKYEPENAKSTMEWGTRQVIKKLESIPDIIYDTGSIGKEPMIRILGKNPKDVVDKIYVLTEKT
jgi:hydroxymethylpyrimidine/phosphomethylpyrimidine kinase